MPKIESKRFYTSQWDDLWGYVLGNFGSVNDGNDGVTVLLAAPDWEGELPKGVDRVIKGESDFLGSLTRTQVLGSDDGLKRVKEIQQGYKLQPLSGNLGKPAPPVAKPIAWPAWSEGDETTEKYWEYVAFLLPFVTPNAADQAKYDELAAFGIERGKKWDASSLDADTRKALQDGMEDARAELDKLGKSSFDPAAFFGDRKKIGTDYLNRALGVYVGIFRNVPEQAVYYTMPADASGALLDGSKASYAITFPPGQLPPVRYFWSFTMYKLPQRWLVDNPIDRYSIGSSTPGLEKNPDGSLTVYFSAKSPGKDKETNWLPAPDGPFWVVLRTYGPGPEILNKSWQPPKIEAGN